MLLGFFIFVALLVLLNPAPLRGDWSKASCESANLVLPAVHDFEPQVQIYTAPAFAWRGKFSVHTWIVFKEKGAKSYITSHVALWNLYRSNSVVAFEEDLPDRYWYGARPKIIFSLSGEEAQKAIPKICAAIDSYPYQAYYRAYPGPNSNSYISHIIRQVPELKTILPSNAIGKDWLCNGRFYGLSEGKSGIQFSLFGLLGIIIGLHEGVEINIIGFSLGISFVPLALRIPVFGEIRLLK
jgi:hypothetical protein